LYNSIDDIHVFLWLSGEIFYMLGSIFFLVFCNVPMVSCGFQDIPLQWSIGEIWH